jgi:Fibronectin type III domain
MLCHSAGGEDGGDSSDDGTVGLDALRPSKAWAPPHPPTLASCSSNSLSVTWTTTNKCANMYAHGVTEPDDRLLSPCRHIQRYELQYRPAEAGDRNWISISSTIKSTKWTVIDLRPDSDYVFRVKFRKFGGWSLFSEPYAVEFRSSLCNCTA